MAKEKLSAEITTKIVDMIVAENYRSGDKLPPERVLAAEFGVSRTTIREALHSLEAIGYIEPKHGGGNYIRDVNFGSMLETLTKKLDSVEKLMLEVIDVRRLLECETARLAALTINDAKKKSITESLAYLKEDIAQNKLGVEGDSHFHETIATAAGNDALKIILQMCRDILNSSRAATLKVPGQGLRTIEDHERIARAICAGDAAGAVQEMTRHLDNAVKNIRK